MQRDFFERLARRAQALVLDLEGATGREVRVEVEEGRASLACRPQDGVIRTPSRDYFPDGGVFHELRHLQRLLVEEIPRLEENLASADWWDGIDEELRRLDNTLEHFVIVPEELALFPERTGHWTQDLRQFWTRGVAALRPGQEQRVWTLVQAAFTELALPGTDVASACHGVLEGLGLGDSFAAYLAELRPVLQQKEELVRVTFRHLEIPFDLAKLKCVDRHGKALP